MFLREYPSSVVKIRQEEKVPRDLLERSRMSGKLAVFESFGQLQFAVNEILELYIITVMRIKLLR